MSAFDGDSNKTEIEPPNPASVFATLPMTIPQPLQASTFFPPLEALPPTAEGTTAIVPTVDTADFETIDRDRRLSLVKSAVQQWTERLLDLGGRNTLLYFKELRAGTLDLSSSENSALTRLIVKGQTVALHSLFRDGELQADAIKRARTIYRKAQELFEERGIRTLYLGAGFATWEETALKTTTPNAPIIMWPITLATSRAAQGNFTLTVSGEPEINIALVRKLAHEFGYVLDVESLLLELESSDTVAVLLQKLADISIPNIPSFGVAPKIELANFFYGNMPMVNDLENSIEALADHDLIAAIVGDEDAHRASSASYPETDIHQPNYVPLQDEFLILDADASQTYAINSVLAGRDLIVQGPPGTGKSQTIANLIATLVARGKKVLFVAEKRAAIDAVLSRLQSRGLNNLVFDLHGGAGSKKQRAQELATTLENVSAIPPTDQTTLNEELSSRRHTLNEHADALHTVHDPWQHSYFDVRAKLTGLPPSAATSIRFRGAVLEGLTFDVYRQACEALREWVSLEGPSLHTSSYPWRAALVRTNEQVQVAIARVERMKSASFVPYARAVQTASANVGLRTPTNLAESQQQLALWSAVAQTLTVFNSNLFSCDLTSLVDVLSPTTQGSLQRAGKTVLSANYRRARKLLKTLLTEQGALLSTSEQWLLLVVARDQATLWHSLAIANSLPQVPSQLDSLLSHYNEALTDATALPSEVGSASLFDFPFARFEGILQQLADDRATLIKIPRLHFLVDVFAKYGMGELLDAFTAVQADINAALNTFTYVWLTSIAEQLELTEPVIGTFNGPHHLSTVSDFQHLDREHLERAADRVNRIWAETVIRSCNAAPHQDTLVRQQGKRARQHMPTRDLLDEARNVILDIKPCWAMSPLVVSQMLPNEQLFDVVIFDEASQITPATAIAAIARGKQLVVAGDSKQLPPTSFFTGENRGDEAVIATGTDGFDSILEALDSVLQNRTLAWHYRSQDEHLIAFSNIHIYDRKLTTFPGALTGDAIEHVHVPWTPGLPGDEVSGAAEVEHVVELVLDHARNRPHESLGVIAMGAKHAERIEEVWRKALEEAEDGPELDTFFSETKDDRFFIKNLERVQGDERDAIILTIGYGKDATGRLPYRFGPLNNAGGERRLNVAITRAKRRMTTVSSFSSADMDPNRSSAEGVRLLRLYLQYAESKGHDLGPIEQLPPELNPFEISVRDALQSAGVPLVAQHGVSNYRIDFAAQHPEKLGTFVLAIECDGASYHSSPTARDRDRLRQEHLERLGWRFHRIWSQDWFTNKAAEIDRAVTAWRAAVNSVDLGISSVSSSPTSPWAAPPPTPPLDPDLLPTSPTAIRSARPLIRKGASIATYRTTELADLIMWIESDGHLRTDEQLLNLAMGELGFRVHGRRIVAQLESAIALAHRRTPSATTPLSASVLGITQRASKEVGEPNSIPTARSSILLPATFPSLPQQPMPQQTATRVTTINGFMREVEPGKRIPEAHILPLAGVGKMYPLGEFYHQEVLKRAAADGPTTEAIIYPKPDNSYDNRAIAVSVAGDIGAYISRDETAPYHLLFDSLRQSGYEAIICPARIYQEEERDDDDPILQLCVRLDDPEQILAGYSATISPPSSLLDTIPVTPGLTNEAVSPLGEPTIPRTASAQMALLKTRPEGWEYLLFAGSLAHGLEFIDSQRKNTSAHRSQALWTSSNLVIAQPLKRFVSAFENAIDLANTAVKPGAMERAFGAPELSGSPILILLMAQGLCAAYDAMLECADFIKQENTADRVPIYEIAARLADQPPLSVQAFAKTFGVEAIRCATYFANPTGPEPEIVTVKLKWDLNTNLLQELIAELDRQNTKGSLGRPL